MTATVTAVSEGADGSIKVLVTYMENSATIATTTFTIDLGKTWGNETRVWLVDSIKEYGRWLQRERNRLATIKAALEGQTININ